MYRAIAAIALTLLVGAAPASAAPPEAKYVGEKTCLKCHDIEDRHFGHTVHAKVFRQNPKNDRERQVCEACHGPGSLHAVRGNHKNRDYLTGFTRNWGTPIEEQNAVCLSCHQGGERLHWSGSTHDTQKLGCSDCHNTMGRFSARGLLKKSSISETCRPSWCDAQPRWVSRICPTFMRLGTPSGFRTRSTGVPSSRCGMSSAGTMREMTPLLP